MKKSLIFGVFLVLFFSCTCSKNVVYIDTKQNYSDKQIDLQRDSVAVVVDLVKDTVMADQVYRFLSPQLKTYNENKNPSENHLVIHIVQQGYFKNFRKENSIGITFQLKNKEQIIAEQSYFLTGSQTLEDSVFRSKVLQKGLDDMYSSLHKTGN